MGLPAGRSGRLVRKRGGGVKRTPAARAERGGGQVEYKNRKWWVRRSASEGDGPRRRWREGPYSTCEEADAACSKATLSYTAATPIGEWLDGWVEKEAKRALLGQREDHARRVRTDVGHVKPYLTHVRIGDVKPSDWMDVWDELLAVPSAKTGKPLSRKTVGNVKTTLSGAMKAAMRDRLLDSNPVRDAPLPTLHRGKEDSVGQLRTIRPDEVLSTPQVLSLQRWLVEQLDVDPFVLPALLILETGMRRGESLGVGWEYVDLTAQTLHIAQQAARIPKVGYEIRPLKSLRSNRVVRLTPTAVEALRQARRQPGVRAFNGLITHNAGEVINPDVFTRWATDTLRPLIPDGPAKWTLHTLRHTHASHLLARGVTLDDVADRLGHSSTIVTQRVYAHALPENRTKAADVWSGLGVALG